ncbi:MAG: TRAP transporter substrate-binding protein [Betaproteobacteria bacterium]|nr:TRAP transporter substrate-binding protein [Betaproteobacteria bacterium]
MHRTIKLALIGAFAVSAIPAAAQEFSLRLHTLLPPVAAPPKTFLIPWTEKLAKESGGKLKVGFFGPMTLGGTPPQLVDQARDGVVDIVWTLPGYTAGRFPKSSVFELPFLHTSAEATTMAIQDFADKHLKDEYKDYHVLLLHAHGGSLFMMREKAVQKVEDFRGLKIRTATSAGALFLKTLGAVPLGMPVPEVGPAMAKGVIDGTMLPYEIAPSQKMQDLATYFVTLSGPQPRMNTSMFAFLMNKASYAKLPADLKKVIDANSGRNLAPTAGKNWDQIEIGGQKVMASKDKNKFLQIPPAEVARMRELAKPALAQWVADMKAKGFNGDELLRDAQTLITKYSK